MTDLGPAWIGVAGVAVGAVTTYLSTVHAERAASRRERDARSHEHEIEDQRRRDAFDREQLEGSQHALVGLWAASTTYARVRAEAGDQGVARLGPEHDPIVQKLGEARSQFPLHVESIYDAHVRELVWAAADALGDVSSVNSSAEFETTSKVVGQRMIAAMTALGTALRDLHHRTP